MNSPPAFPGKQKALLIKSEHSDIAKEYEIDQNGMTLRDYFAGEALSGLINYSPEPDEHKAIAELCYSLADAMMKVRETK